MSKTSVFARQHTAAKLVAAGLAAAFLGGCASDVTRFSDPFSNPFSSANADPSPTGTVGSAAPVAAVQSQPLAPSTYPSYGARPNAVPPRQAAVEPRPSEPTRLAGGASGWSAAGGTPVVVASGESAALLSQRYGIPTAALLKANGLSSGAEVRPGTRLIIPVYHGGSAEAARDVTDRPRLASRDPEERGRPGRETRARVAAAEPDKPERGARSSRAKVAAAEPGKPERGAGSNRAKVAAAEPDKPEKGAKSKLAKHVTPSEKPEPTQSASAKIALPKAAPSKVASAQPKALPAPAAPAARATAAAGTDPTPTASLPAATADAGKPEFRWPARGRIIQGFKPGGNDGINIAVPEGTSVKAAEAGVVAYAGSELKGYGNMILIRHPNGFVSAYANNGELDVKRGDQVKRGQIIAKSGQSGNVSAPQLHFELRKGSTPVDPTGYLAGL